MTLNERAITSQLRRYFLSKGLSPIGKLNVFDHLDDADERTFIVDFAFGPIASKGNRTHEVVCSDIDRFREHESVLDSALNDLLVVCEFPANVDIAKGWSKQANPDPMVGLAIEVENAKSKYFLGSLLAASCTGRWGLLVVPDTPETSRWIMTVRRMIHKGSRSPIPSNIVIFKWNRLEEYINSEGNAD
jgi:hypothetical protein